MAGGVILITWMSWLTVRHTTDVSAKDAAHSNETKAVASASAVGSVANQGKALAKNVTSQCKTDAGFRKDNPTLCVQASVLATVTPSAVPGPQGPAGRGITSVHNVAGHLVLSYTDGTAQDAGRFVGPAGKNGTNGRGITAQTIVGGHLVATYTDDTVVDLGQVVGIAGKDGTAGPAGVSVTSVTADPDTHVVTVAYSDGQSATVGTLPPGPKGDKGEPGSDGASGSPGLPPGAIIIQVPGPLPNETTTETCTPPPGATDPAAQPTAPTYTCS